MKSVVFDKPQAMIFEDTEDAQTTSTEKEDSNIQEMLWSSSNAIPSFTKDILLARYLQDWNLIGVLADLFGVSGARKSWCLLLVTAVVFSNIS